MSARGSVSFPVPVEVAFDYLVDPVNRPAWQSSLRRVELLDDAGPRVGQRWVDVTRPGPRPLMETVALDRPRHWGESGAWRGFTAYLGLDFVASGAGCEVAFEFGVTGRGQLKPVGLLLTAAAGPAVRTDLRSAARLLSARGDP